MELKDYLRILLKNTHIALIFVVAISAYTFLDYSKNPYTYQGSVTFTVGNSSRNQSTILNYDHYYNILSSGSVSDMVIGVLASPTYINNIYHDADTVLPTTEAHKLTKLIKTSKNSPESNMVNAIITDSNEENTSRLILSTSKVVQTQFDMLKKTNVVADDFQLIASEPYTAKIPKNLSLNLIISIVASIILASAFIFLKDALSPKK